MRAARLVLRCALWVAVAVVGLLVVLVVVVPRVTDSVALTVLSGSMAPAIPAGSVVVVREVPPSELAVGDVVTFQTQAGVDSYVTHRVVEVIDDTLVPYLVTQGDANEAVDVDPVPVDAVRGRVWYSLPLVGWPSGWTGMAGRGQLIVVVGLLGFAALQLVKLVQERKRPVPRSP